MAEARSQPRFCAWCGAPLEYEEHHHEPRYATLREQARQSGENPPPLPDRVEELLRGESYIGACANCRVLSHVISHHTPEGPG